MPLTILFTAKAALWPKYHPLLAAGFAKAGLDVRLVTETSDPASIDYLIYAPTAEDEDLSGFTNLKLIQSLWAGPDKLLRNPTLTQPLARMVDPGMSEGMVEYVTGHILRYHLNTDQLERLEEGEWRNDLSPPLARQRTVGFLGLGALGLACARAAQALNFNILGWSRGPKEGLGFACFSGQTGLDTLLEQSDIVVALLPATPQTDGLLGASRLAKIKYGAALINAGRSNILDEAALIAALKAGRLRGATLDVFDAEPLPQDHPFWTLPQVLSLIHI